MFTNERLKKLIIPLVIEQILAVTMGMADTMMIASCGEAAVSGISIVDSISVLLVGLFAAMATGGAVVAAQFIGREDRKGAAQAANQLFLVVGGVAIVLMLTALLFNAQILRLIYGHIEPEVMGNARTYFYVMALSYPFLGVYNGAAALFRAEGNSKISMKISLVVNVMNVVGNAILIFGFDMGVLGAAISTLVSRMVAAVVMMYLLQRPDSPLPLRIRLQFDKIMIQRILRIGIPNGLENSIFQIGKLILSSLIAGFGTVSIAANAVASTVCGLETIPASAIGIALLTVVGQCVGADELEQARGYMEKLIKITYLCLIVVNVGVILLLNPICSLYRLSPETSELARQLMFYHSICCVLLHPLSFTLPNGLRAANDVKYTMMVSIGSMWFFRIALGYILGRNLGMGVMGVWIAMTIDWLVRAIFFGTRVLNGKWKKYVYSNR